MIPDKVSEISENDFMTCNGNSKNQFMISKSGKSLYILAINIKLRFV